MLQYRARKTAGEAVNPLFGRFLSGTLDCVSTWAIVLVVVAAWIVVSIVVALVVARAIKIRDEKERGPSFVPDYVPDDAPSRGPGTDG